MGYRPAALKPPHVAYDGTMQDVVKANPRVYTSAYMNPQVKTYFWELWLRCGHRVERWIRWNPAPPGESRHGYAAMHHSPDRSRMPDPPKRARCSVEKRGTR